CYVPNTVAMEASLAAPAVRRGAQYNSVWAAPIDSQQITGGTGGEARNIKITKRTQFCAALRHSGLEAMPGNGLFAGAAAPNFPFRTAKAPSPKTEPRPEPR